LPRAIVVNHYSSIRASQQGSRWPKRGLYLFMKYFLAGTAIGLILFLGSCSADEITGPGDVIFPDSNVSYRAHVAPFLAVGCTMSGCHDAATPQNRYTDLRSWIGVRAINVINQPGDTNAALVQVLYGRTLHPPLSNEIGENQRRGIKRWVLEGARDN
jgi:hypothetical protein